MASLFGIKGYIQPQNMKQVYIVNRVYAYTKKYSCGTTILNLSNLGHHSLQLSTNKKSTWNLIWYGFG